MVESSNCFACLHFPDLLVKHVAHRPHKPIMQQVGHVCFQYEDACVHLFASPLFQIAPITLPMDFVDPSAGLTVLRATLLRQLRIHRGASTFEVDRRSPASTRASDASSALSRRLRGSAPAKAPPSTTWLIVKQSPLRWNAGPGAPPQIPLNQDEDVAPPPPPKTNTRNSKT